jgi:hypothetical protein
MNLLTIQGLSLFEKNTENGFSSQNQIEISMVPPESTPQELSNEWS